MIDFGKLIVPVFYPVHRDIVKGGHTYYDLYGGRGGLKSSFISLEIILGMMKDEQANAAIFRKYAVTLRESVYEQILWAIDVLGVSHLWEVGVSPMQCTYRPTGQKIIFRGLDKAKKTKSLKASHGYFKYLWFEELDEFQGPEEIRTVQQSVLRGGEKFVVFKSFNPPISISNWANQYVNEPRSDSYRHKSSYLDAPPEWLGQQFIDDAEHLKEVNERAYQHEYLGDPVGTGGQVFEFLEIRTITDEEMMQFDRIYQGIDFGWMPDPMAFIRCSFNSSQEKIYLLDEYVGTKISNEALADEIKKRRYNDYDVICDSAEPKSIADLRRMGIHARAVDKGAGSVEYGMKWLQRRTIVIDPKRTPNAYKEIIEYEYDRDKEGNLLSGYPDKNNHCIDSLRYALYRAIFSWKTKA
ncbi:MAG: PBSX family phage terminase large subunit [Lachnospiraceae bacterium]|nr:PBSX family phage terminase large subunit [Lachnospiraceae bacterium]